MTNNKILQIQSTIFHISVKKLINIKPKKKKKLKIKGFHIFK